jgi:hypothetical protein
LSGRARIAAFGSAGALVVIGIACAVLLGGGFGQTLAFVLIGIGLVVVTSLVFLEIGLSEDRERDRAQRSERERRRSERKRRSEISPGRGSSDPPPLDPRRRLRGVLGRARDHRRRLR